VSDVTKQVITEPALETDGVVWEELNDLRMRLGSLTFLQDDIDAVFYFLTDFCVMVGLPLAEVIYHVTGQYTVSIQDKIEGAGAFEGQAEPRTLPAPSWVRGVFTQQLTRSE
jgi:hypothetical protein